MTDFTEIRSTAPMSFVMSCPGHDDIVIKGANDLMAVEGVGHTIVPVAMFEAWLEAHPGLDMIENGALVRVDPVAPAAPAAPAEPEPAPPVE